MRPATLKVIEFSRLHSSTNYLAKQRRSETIAVSCPPVWPRSYLLFVTLTNPWGQDSFSFHSQNKTVAGHRLLTKVNVAAAIADAQAKRLENAGISAERVLKEIAKVGFALMRHVMVIESDGQPQINLSTTPDDDLDALLEIQTETVVERDGVGEDGKPTFNRIRKTKIKLHDKLNALEKLAQHNGVYAKRDEDQVRAFAKASNEIQTRTSRAPIRCDEQLGDTA